MKVRENLAIALLASFALMVACEKTNEGDADAGPEGGGGGGGGIKLDGTIGGGGGDIGGGGGAIGGGGGGGGAIGGTGGAIGGGPAGGAIGGGGGEPGGAGGGPNPDCEEFYEIGAPCGAQEIDCCVAGSACTAWVFDEVALCRPACDLHSEAEADEICPNGGDVCLPQDNTEPGPQEAWPGNCFENDGCTAEDLSACDDGSACIYIGGGNTQCQEATQSGPGDLCGADADGFAGCQADLLCTPGSNVWSCSPPCDDGACMYGDCVDLNEDIEGLTFCAPCNGYVKEGAEGAPQVNPGCGEGEYCIINGLFSDDGNQWHWACVAGEDGAAQPGEACVYDEDNEDENYFGTCTSSSFCNAAFPERDTTCERLCTQNTLCNRPEDTCMPFGLEGGGVIRLCVDSECDVVTNEGCDDNETCVMASAGNVEAGDAEAGEAWIGFCAPGDGSVMTGELCEVDEENGGHDCQVNHDCIDLGEGNTCYQLCVIGGAACATEGYVCLPWMHPFDEAADGQLGVCAEEPPEM